LNKTKAVDDQGTELDNLSAYIFIFNVHDRPTEATAVMGRTQEMLKKKANQTLKSSRPRIVGTF